ncbi:MAG: cyclic pyranopterin monophosphate synthase MoaC [Actinobacteria bacterium]|nr:MAG: cyclic pyranopterin monophosphate synthase MoaC [Actinomycetota bacterium]
MVDVSSKRVTARTAVARASIGMDRETLDLILADGIEKGDVLGTARIAGIMAAKKTSELIPMCHPIAITSVELDFEVDRKTSTVTAVATARTRDRTGVEMEALTAAAVAALTVYDMCKAVDRSMTITSLQLVKKSGGRSGTYARE